MRAYIILAAIVLAGILPFSSRAVFMDEHIFLKIAESAQHNWLFPQDVPSVFFGIPTANFAAHTHPPVGEYFLAMVWAALGHFSELPFRIAFSVFSITTILAFYFLARRFTEQPFLVALLLAASPAFFVMAPTLMMDIPMLAFLLLGVASYFAYLEGRKWALGLAAACFVLSAGTGYTMLVPLGCLFILMMVGRRPWTEKVALLAAPAALLAWQLAMTLHLGGLPIIKTIAFFRSTVSTPYKIAATLSFLGGTAVFPWMMATIGEKPRLRVIGICLAIAALFALTYVPNWPLRVWYVILAGAGLLVLWAFARSSAKIVADSRNSGEAFLFLWVPATLLFFIVVADMINARYILLALPALYLVLFRHATRRQLTIALVPTAVLSICIAYADFQYVNAYRDWEIATVPPIQAQGFHMWGASESGLRFYLERHHVPTLASADFRPSGTDLIVRHDLYRYGLSEEVETMLTVLKRFTLTSTFPIRTFNAASGAGFHDSRIGLTPFAISQAPFDVVEVSQMSPFVASLPQKGTLADDIPAWSPIGVILKQNVDLREFKVSIPANSKLEYDLAGRGVAEITPTGIALKRLEPQTIVWRSLRIVPAQFLDNR